MKKTILILTVLLFCTEIVLSQGFYNKNRNRNLILSVGSGTTHYFGDLAKAGDFTNIKPNFGIGARYNFYRWFSAGAEVTWFMLAGDDKTDPGKEIRNLSFQSHNFDLLDDQENYQYILLSRCYHFVLFYSSHDLMQ